MNAVIIDSHPGFISGLTTFLEEYYEGIEIFRSSSIALFDAQKGSLEPDFMVLGINHHFNPGEILIFEMVKRAMALTPVILYYNEFDMLTPFLQCGVNGIIPKYGKPAEIIDCIASILHGDRYFCSEVFNRTAGNWRLQ